MQTPGLVVILGLWVGLTLAERLSPAFKTNPNVFYNLVFTVMISGVVGARIIYVARYLEIFLGTPLNLFSLNPGLIDPIGGVGVGIIAALIYTNRNNMSLWLTLAAFTPLLAVLMIAISLSQLASGDAFGIETSLPWGIELWGAKRHPTQIYYTLAGLATLFFIWPRHAIEATTEKETGKTFLIFLALSAAARLFLDAFRADSNLILFGIRTSQVISWIVLALSLWGLINIRSLIIESNGENDEK